MQNPKAAVGVFRVERLQTANFVLYQTEALSFHGGMDMNHKVFAERLNKELDAIELPLPQDERVNSFSKWLKIPKFKADALISGVILPDQNLLALLSEEFDVSEDWLLGKSEQRQKKSKV